MKDKTIQLEEPKQILHGVYPGNVVGFEESKRGNAYVVNLTIRIAELPDDYTAWTPENEEEEINAKHMEGEEFKSRGIWINFDPDQKKRNWWYYSHFKNMGIEFPKSKDGKPQICQVEEKDILGKGIVFELGYEYNNGRKFHKVLNYLDMPKLKPDDIDPEVLKIADAFGDDTPETGEGLEQKDQF